MAPALFSALAALDQLCSAATAAVGAANFGRFSNDGSCSYDCGFMEQDWNWWFDVTDWMQSGTFDPLIAGMNLLAPFTNAFSLTKQWVSSSLPADDRTITHAIDTIMAIDAAIKRSGSETPAQSTQLADAFNAAVPAVANSLAAADRALQTLAGYISWVKPTQPNVTNVLSSTTTMVDTWIQGKAMDLIQQLHCGGGTVQDQYNAAQAVVNGSITSLAAPLGAAASQEASAIDAGCSVAAAFLNIQAMSELVTRALGHAQAEEPGSAMRLLNMTEALENWRDLVTFANQQLSTG